MGTEGTVTCAAAVAEFRRGDPRDNNCYAPTHQVPQYLRCNLSMSGVGLKLTRFDMVYNVVRAKYVDLNGRGGKYRGEAQPNLR